MNIRRPGRYWEKFELFEEYDRTANRDGRTNWFANKLTEYDFDSIFEVGAFTGRNLKRIAEDFPGINISGIDINAKAIEYAKKTNFVTNLEVVNVYDMPTDDKYDIVFTMGVLIHLHPEGLKDVLRKCIDKSNKYVMHMENNGNGTIWMGPKNLNPVHITHEDRLLHWFPTIVESYKGLGYEAQVIELPESALSGGVKNFVIVSV